MVDIGLTILLNALPLILLVIPLIFIWKKTIGKLYFRIVIGILVFYLIYWVLPIIFQLGAKPNELTVESGDEGNIALGIGYMAAHFGTLIAYFAYYPLITLPFIFFVAPFIALLIIWNKLRKEDGTIKENLKELTYEYSKSPLEKIKEDLMANNWTREKQILKLLIVLLPISLYLLQVILDISNMQTVSLTDGSTALGWFIEILFIYLAVFIFSIELLFSSQIALKGRYFGEKIREQTYKSLYQVGAPISIISLFLFVIQYTSSIGIIIYFFAYFIMASIIFILFIDIFEPISNLIFIKLIDWWRNKDVSKEKRSYSNLAIVIFYSLIVLVIFFVINMVASIFLQFDPEMLKSANFSYKNPSLVNSMKIDLFNIITTSAIIASIVIAAYILSFGLNQLKNISLSFIAFLPVLIIIAIVLNISEEFWITGQISYMTVFGDDVYTLRTATFNANLFSGGNITLLGVLAQPYIYTRHIFSVFIWALIIFYIGKEFSIKSLSVDDDKYVEKTTYTLLTAFIGTKEYMDGKNKYLISKSKDIIGTDSEQQREEVIQLLNLLEKDQLLHKIKPDTVDEQKRFYYTLKYLFMNNQIKIWNPEFSLRFEKVEKQGLYIIYDDGRDVFNYPFVEDIGQDPALISGMFSAITSFIKETTQSTQLLRTIDHGDVTILIEYGKYIFGALFIKGNQTSEIRAQLKKFVAKFEVKHKDHLVSWNGALAHFRHDAELVEEIFKEV